MEKPNFERISRIEIIETGVYAYDLINSLSSEDWKEVLSGKIYFPNNPLLEGFLKSHEEELQDIFEGKITFSKGRTSEELKEGYETQWKDILEGVIYYPELPKLESLLKEYGLEDLFADFRYMGFTFSEWVLFEKELNPISQEFHSFELEKLKAIEFLMKENGNLKFEIKSVAKKKSVSIQNTKFVDILKQSIIDYFKNNEMKFDHEQLKIVPLLTTINAQSFDWQKYIESRLAIQKSIILKRGRPASELNRHKIVRFLMYYLQVYTHLKYSRGATYSNEQARFIYSFMEIFGLIEKSEERSSKEEIIAYYLKTIPNIPSARRIKI